MNAQDRKEADRRLRDCPYRKVKQKATRVSEDGKAYVGLERVSVCGDMETLDATRQKCLHCQQIFPLHSVSLMTKLKSRIKSNIKAKIKAVLRR